MARETDSTATAVEVGPYTAGRLGHRITAVTSLLHSLEHSTVCDKAEADDDAPSSDITIGLVFLLLAQLA